MKLALYTIIARRLNAMQSCHETHNDEWYDKHQEAIETT